MAAGKHGGRVATRFPPEPNGYLHVGHASAICLNFGIAAENGGVCHLRFDDTNPTKEDTEYVESIIEDVRWLGWDWGEHLYYSSDYFEQLYEFAVKLIRDGRAYVCDLSQKEIREYRGTPTEPGRNSPYRDRSVEENLSLFEGMRAGEFEEGSRVLRAKIDMASGNLNLRDPVIYRILKVPTTAPATPGAYTRRTTSPRGSPTRSSASPTRSAPPSSKTTARYTTGCSTRSACSTRSRSSSRAGISATPS